MIGVPTRYPRTGYQLQTDPWQGAMASWEVASTGQWVNANESSTAEQFPGRRGSERRTVLDDGTCLVRRPKGSKLRDLTNRQTLTIERLLPITGLSRTRASSSRGINCRLSNHIFF